MAWKLTAAGVRVDTPIPDQMVDYIKEQLRALDDPSKGLWLMLGDQSEEGATQVFLTPATPLILERVANDPSELLYKFESSPIED